VTGRAREAEPAADLGASLQQAIRRVGELRAGLASPGADGVRCHLESTLEELDAVLADLRAREEEHARRLAAEQAARGEAEATCQRLTNILESISDGFVALDQDARITYLNRRAEVLLGRSRKELIGHVGWETFPELKGSVFEREYRRATEAGVSVSIEEFYPPLQGWVELHAFPTADGLAIYFRNITGRKRARENERFLAASSAALAASIDHGETLETVAGLGIPFLADSSILYILGDDGVVHRAHSRHADAAKCATLREALERVPRDPHVPDSPVVRVMKTGRTELIPTVPDEFIRKLATDDHHLTLLESIAPHSLMVLPLVSRGRTFGALSLGRTEDRPAFGDADVRLGEDLAARAALAIDNARLHAEARRAAQARQDVLHVVSHDLRNSLNALLLHAEILQAKAPEPERRQRGQSAIAAIQRAALGMHRMVQDLLDADSVRAGRLSIRPERMEVLDVVRQSVQILEPLLAHRSMELRPALEPGLPLVEADPERIQQVLINLIGNAIKFSPEGTVIDLIVDRSTEEAGELCFRVQDGGPGIAPEDLTRVFERNWQGPLGRQIGRGAGLGLAIAEGIVHAHGGRIWALSEVGKGSTFCFTLPVRQ